MKKILTMVLAAGLLITGCDKYDDSDLRGKIDNLDGRVKTLEDKVNKLNSDISAIQAIVNALKDNDYVKSVTPVVQDGKEIGYTIVFTKSAPVTIYHGKNGTNGTNGTTPQISVKKDTDGIYYWTLNGEWLLDSSGQKVRATGPQGEPGAPGVGTPGSNGENGITPQLKIEDGYWFVSYDNGSTWTKLGKAQGENGAPGVGTPGSNGENGITHQLKIEEGYWFVSYDNGSTWTKLYKATGEDGEDGDDGDSFFKDVTVGDKSVTFTLTDGTSFTLPFYTTPISFLNSDIQAISKYDNKVYIKIDNPSPDATYVANLETVDGVISTKSAGSWEVKLSLNPTGDLLTATITPDGDIEMVLLTITCITPESSHRISKILVDGSPKDISTDGTANCYIISGKGNYKFPTVIGNSAENVPGVVYAEVLWETYGTEEYPNPGDLVQNAMYEDGYISFTTTGRKGNAVIAAKGGVGEVLWSWHIWMTDQPEDQVYNNDAGTMMDRNLGAISATPGDVGALGLFYQWGRKDPFLGLASISEAKRAVSTFPESWGATKSTETEDSIKYATAHPMTYIRANLLNLDWYYTGSSSVDNTRWTSTKTIYDPCPPGYRVPDGGEKGAWSKAFGTSSQIKSDFDSTNTGHNFVNTSSQMYLTAASNCWYPAAGCLVLGGGLDNIGIGNYWSCTIYSDTPSAFRLLFDNDRISTKSIEKRAYGLSVRCMKE